MWRESGAHRSTNRMRVPCVEFQHTIHVSQLRATIDWDASYPPAIAAADHHELRPGRACGPWPR
jgi:hypothetical protein